MTPSFFGYGSLVNRATHDYPGAQPAQLHGWRRVWVRTDLRDVVFLSVRPDPGTTIARTPSATRALCAISAAARRSSIRELVQDPIKTRCTGVPAIGAPGFKSM